MNTNRPQSLSEMFWRFSWLALQGFGGVFPVAQRELVEKHRWLSREEFIEDWAVAQVMPGPNVVNLGLIIGNRYFGVMGGLVAVLGLLTFPLVLVLTLVFFYSNFAQNDYTTGALRGMGAVAAGLIGGTSLKLAQSFKSHPLKWPFCTIIATVCFFSVVYLKLSLISVLLIFGTSSMFLTYKKLNKENE